MKICPECGSKNALLVRELKEVEAESRTSQKNASI
jgi:hypothetical protein